MAYVKGMVKARAEGGRHGAAIGRVQPAGEGMRAGVCDTYDLADVKSVTDV